MIDYPLLATQRTALLAITVGVRPGQPRAIGWACALGRDLIRRLVVVRPRFHVAVRYVPSVDGSTSGEPPVTEQLMQLTRSVAANCQVLVVSGEIDALTVPRLTDALQTIFDAHQGARVVLDLSRVRFLASSGLRVLLEMTQEGVRQHEPLYIVVDQARPVIRPIQVAGLRRRLELFHSVDDAVAHRA
jgi:anti-sigma B factor antagonist